MCYCKFRPKRDTRQIFSGKVWKASIRWRWLRSGSFSGRSIWSWEKAAIFCWIVRLWESACTLCIAHSVYNLYNVYYVYNVNLAIYSDILWTELLCSVTVYLVSTSVKYCCDIFWKQSIAVQRRCCPRGRSVVVHQVWESNERAGARSSSSFGHHFCVRVRSCWEKQTNSILTV